MKTSWALFLILMSTNIHAQMTIDSILSVYGDDNRQEVARASRSHQKLADSTAALIVNSFMVKEGSSHRIDAPTLEQQDGVCATERYRDQPAASVCSGTLIAPDLMLTAAHCYTSAATCTHASWVFGFHESRNGKYKIKNKEIYKCKEVVYRAFSIKDGKDFAIVKLDRKVKGHSPVELRQEGSAEVNTKLVLIGHPRGLPTKIADDAWITSIKDGSILMSNLDAYTGNSGSGVFNAEAGFLEGVLSFGNEDYLENEQASCFSSQVYRMQDGGEAIMKIDPVRDFLKTYQTTRP
ncbi:MAG: serine protease [Bdellovibrionota bacterium]